MNSVLEIITSNAVLEIIEQGNMVVLEDNQAIVEVVSPGQTIINTTGGSSGFEHTQVAAAATWTIAHGLGRLPNVAVYLNSGEEVETDVTSTSTQVSITFPTATAGKAVLT
jgi:hypothetical protein